MAVNKDQPSSWIKYKDGSCDNCIATCCTIPVEVKAQDLIRLGYADEFEVLDSEKKLAKKLIKEKIVQTYREKTGLFLLSSKPNGDCQFLNSETRRCTVYSNRPNVCRQFPTEIGNKLGYCPKINKSQLKT